MPQQDEWKPIGNSDWVPITPPKPLDTRLKDPITLQPKTNVVEPFKGMPLSTLENIKFSGPPDALPYESKGLWQGLKDVPEELYHHISTTGKSSAEKLIHGDIPGAIHDVIQPISAPFEYATKGVVNTLEGKPPFDIAPNQKEQTWQGVNTVGSVVGLPGQAFREAWEHSDYPRLTGQAIGAVASLAIPHYVGNKLRNYDLSIKPDLPSNDVLSQSQLDTSTQVELFEKGLSHEEISKITPEEANDILGGGAGHIRPSVMNPEAVAGIRQQARNVEPPSPTVEQGAPSTPSIPRTAEMEPVPYTAGQDLSWPEKPSAEVISQLASEGMEPYQDNQGNWFFRLVKESSGHFDPTVVWNKLVRLLGRDPTLDELNAEIRKNPTIVPPGIARGAENSWPQKASANWDETGGRVSQVVSQQDAEQQAARTIARNRGVLPSKFFGDEAGIITNDPAALARARESIQQEMFDPSEIPDTRNKMLYRGGYIDPPAPMWNNADGTPNRYFAGNKAVADNFSNLRNEPLWGLNLPETQAAQFETGGNRGGDGIYRVPQDIARQAVKIHPSIPEVPQPQQGFIDFARRFIGDESGHLDPTLLWKNVRRYFENPDPPEDINAWRTALIRAAAAGDMEATSVINARVRELEQQSNISHTTPPELVEPMVNAPPIQLPDAPRLSEPLDPHAVAETMRNEPPVRSSSAESQAFTQPATDYDAIPRTGTDGVLIPRPSELNTDIITAQNAADEFALNNVADYWNRIIAQAVSMQDQPTLDHASRVVDALEIRRQELGVPPTNSLTNQTPQQQMEATTNALANEAGQTTAAPSIQINYLWEGWDLQDRWHDLRESARAAGDDTAVQQAQEQIELLDQQMDVMRNQPRDARSPVTVTDPSTMEGAYAHLGPPPTSSNFGANWSAATRTPPAPRTPPINTPFAGMPRRPYVAPDVIRQQMESLGIRPEQEQWYRSLNDESLEFPEEGNQPSQPSLGLDEEIDPVTGLTNAQISELDPNFTPKEYVTPEGEGRYQPRLRLREEPWYTEADIDELERTMNAAANNGLGLNYGIDQIRNLPNGKPGLEVKASGGSYWDAFYRDANGRPVATASGSTRGISNLGAEIKKPRTTVGGTQENKGIGTGRPVYAVLRGLIKKGVPLKVNSSLSPYSRAMVKSFIEQARKFLAEEKGSLSLDPEVWKEGWENLRGKTGWGMGRSGDTPFKFSDVIEGRAREKEEAPTNIFKEAVTLPTVATTIDDMSGAGRQGLSQILTPEFWKAGKDMYRGAWTPELFDKVDAEVRNLPLFREYRDSTTGKLIPSKGAKMGIKISAPGHRLGPREEGTASRWIETGGMFGPETIGGYNNPIRSTYKHTFGVGARISNRGLTTFLNVLRANRAQKLMDLAAGMANEGMRTGKMPMEGVLGGMKMPDFLGGEHIGFKQNVTMEEAAEKNPYLNDVLAREIGDFVNTATGRGPLKTHILPFKQAEVSLEGAADKLGYALFSPRNFAAKARMMNPNTYIMASPFVRKQYLKAILSTGAAWYTFTELAKLADPSVQVNHDPTNADFGKVRIGDYRMDPAGGFQQFLVLYSRLLTGGSTSSASNRFRKFGSGPTAETERSTIERFGANKLNPVARFAYDFASASKRQPFQVMDRTMQMYLPLVAQDAYEIYKEDPGLFPWMVPVIHGWGSQIYGKDVNEGKFINRKNDWTITGGGPMDWFGMNK